MLTHLIYIVDDEAVAREGLAMVLQKDYRVKSFADAESALASLAQDAPDLVLLDIGLPGMSGIEALGHIKHRRPDILVLMITAYEEVQSVVSAMKLGAHEYLVKPLQMDPLLICIRNALETVSLRKEVRSLQEKVLQNDVPFLIGDSSAVQRIMEVVNKVARSPDTPVLILGETGTGKELIARAIHCRGPHFKGPLVSVNCAAIPKELIESELFGYDRGAFSGADPGGKKGLVEKAVGGTLFLDEVADLTADAQAKLLRFLESGEYYRLGGTQKLAARTRIVSATNRNLSDMVAAGRFRRDLYFRLAVIEIKMPSLNERREDILPIANHFLMEFSGKFGKSFTGISPRAQAALLQRHYTGNVRELKNMIEREVLFNTGPLLELSEQQVEPPRTSCREQNRMPGSHLLPPLTTDGIDLPTALKKVEEYYITAALSLSGGNDSRAASLLSFTRDTFRYRKKKSA